MKIECKRHKWGVGAGIGAFVNGNLETIGLNIWCEKCNKKIKAFYNPYLMTPKNQNSTKKKLNRHKIMKR